MHLELPKEFDIMQPFEDGTVENQEPTRAHAEAAYRARARCALRWMPWIQRIARESVLRRGRCGTC